MTDSLLRRAPIAARPALAETLHRLRERTPYLGVRLGQPEGPGWLRATDLTADDSPHLPRLMAGIGAAHGTARRDVPASFFFHGYSWLLAAVGVGAYLTDRRVPWLAPAAVMVRFGDEGHAAELALLADRFTVLPTDPAAGHPAATVVADEDGLRDAMRAEIEAHLAPLVDAVRAQAPLGRRALWLAAADNCAWSVVHHAAGDADGAGCRAEVAALTQAARSPLRGRTRVLEVAWNERRERFVARGSCCLSYKLAEGAHCANCPLLPPEEQERRLRADLAEAT